MGFSFLLIILWTKTSVFTTLGAFTPTTKKQFLSVKVPDLNPAEAAANAGEILTIFCQSALLTTAELAAHLYSKSSSSLPVLLWFCVLCYF